MPRNYSVRQTIEMVKQKINKTENVVEEPEEISIQDLTEEILDNDTSFLIKEEPEAVEKKKSILESISEKFKFWIG